MNEPETSVVANVRCLYCGKEATIPVLPLVEGVITLPVPRCATCPGFPEMSISHFDLKGQH